MKKLHPLIKSEMLKTFPSVQSYMLGEQSSEMVTKCNQGFLFSFDDWTGDYKMEKLEHIENAQYAIIETLFEDFIDYLENTEDFTESELRKFSVINEVFHEYLRELCFFKFQNQNITTINEAVAEFKEVNFFMPTTVLKDGKFIDISNHFTNVVYF